MARNVYLDPFGTYTSAYDKGMARQMDVENNRRAARATDFDYNYMLPLRYQTAQRENQFGEAAMPYRIKDLGYGERATRAGLFNSEYGAGQTLARDFGLVDPALSAVTGYLPNYGFELNPESGGVDWTRGGEYIGQNTIQSILQRFMQPEIIAEGERMRQADQQRFTNDVQIQQLDNNRRYQDAILWQSVLGGRGGAGLGAPSAANNFGLWDTTP